MNSRFPFQVVSPALLIGQLTNEPLDLTANTNLEFSPARTNPVTLEPYAEDNRKASTGTKRVECRPFPFHSREDTHRKLQRGLGVDFTPPMTIRPSFHDRKQQRDLIYQLGPPGARHATSWPSEVLHTVSRLTQTTTFLPSLEPMEPIMSDQQPEPTRVQSRRLLSDALLLRLNWNEFLVCPTVGPTVAPFWQHA